MKRLTIILISTAMLLLGHELKAQVDWNLGGNSPTTSEFLGTINAQPLQVKTHNVLRAKLNPTVTYTVNGHSAQRNGYLLVGHSTGFSSSLFSSSSEGAYSLLHLNGPNGTFVQTGGHRPWMQTGMTLTDNDDMSYLGLRAVGTGTDLTETVISWSDNSGSVIVENFCRKHSKNFAQYPLPSISVTGTISQMELTETENIHQQRNAFGVVQQKRRWPMRT